MAQVIEPTEEEKRNGWTRETLTAYVNERMAAQSEALNPHADHRRVKPSVQNSKFNPKRWRG